MKQVQTIDIDFNSKFEGGVAGEMDLRMIVY